MGIGGFHGWMSNRFPGAYVAIDGEEVHHLYVDLSSVLHAVVRKSRHMDDFVFKLNTKLLYILEIADPTVSVVFAMDGPAPLAKLLTQRSRRQKDARRTSNDFREVKEVSKQALTPGTPFMLEVQSILEFFICQRLCSRRWGGVEFELLGCTVEGEGELKIIDRIQARRACVHNSDNHVILGGDSDLMLMAMLSWKPNLYVINDNQAMFSSHIGLHGDKMVRHAAEQRRLLSAFSVNGLRDAWSQEAAHLVQTEDDMRQLTLDFATIVITANGNDYLPAVRGILSSKTENAMWERYLQLRTQGKPEHDGGLVTEVPLTSLTESGAWGRWTTGLSVNEALMTRLLKDCSSWIPIPNHDPSDGYTADKAGSYLQGLAWNLNMYIEGQCCDYRYVYHGSGPTASEFVARLSEDGTSSGGNASDKASMYSGALLGPLDAIKQRLLAADGDRTQHAERGHAGDKAAMLKRNTDLGRPLLPNAFAMALMPGSAIAYVPAPLQHLMAEGSPIADIYRECPACTKLSKESSQLQTAYNRVRAKISALTQEIESWEEAQEGNEEAEAGENDPMRTARDMLVVMEEQAEEWKAAVRDLQLRQQDHQDEEHPYEPFPVARLEQAVRSIPQSQYSSYREKQVTRFGLSYCFRRGAPANAKEKLFQLPLPPVSAWKRLRIPSKNPITREVIQKGGQPSFRKENPANKQKRQAKQQGTAQVEVSASLDMFSQAGYGVAEAAGARSSHPRTSPTMMRLNPAHASSASRLHIPSPHPVLPSHIMQKRPRVAPGIANRQQIRVMMGRAASLANTQISSCFARRCQ